ncbi:MAG: UDP-3-O-(3-hydroxymyristoyl)glucosamine N-acyltransferase [Desulfacinum sp.]|jgi:UDP-3-O-[3-hydroxymyristoyl] glucosamine N-acyltransferase|nr:UDP-3-O-(3-hydroxymyristoyl)glucosamine N-acyltransferase [Desulfacinum sp.]
MAKKEYTLQQMAELLGVERQGPPDLVIRGVGPLQAAGPDQLSFLANPKYKSQLESSRAGAVIVHPSVPGVDRPRLLSSNPYWTMAKAAQLFHEPPDLPVGIHPTAVVAADARIAPDAALGPLVHVGPGSSVGSGTRIYGHVHIAGNVTVGEECLIHPNVTILDGCRIGDRVIIHSGTVIGSDGFGFAQDDQGRSTKIPQTGIVVIEDDVEIGANCAVDRATFGVTRIGRGTKIDNLVQIAHNVDIGEHSIIVAQVGISGSVTLGRHVVLGGQVGIAGHLTVGDGVRIGAKSAIAHSVPPGQDLLGIPAIPHKEWFRNYANWKRLPRLRDELARLRERVDALEKELGRHGKDD